MDQQRPAVSNQSDHLLDAYLSANETVLADQALAQLLSLYVKPKIEEILSSKLQNDTHRQEDFDDLHSDVVTQVLTRLRKIKDTDGAGRMDDFDQYVASVTNDTWDQYVLNSHPMRTRLRGRLQYVLTRHPELDMWQKHTLWLCGYKEWKDLDTFIDRDGIRTVSGLSSNQDLPEQLLSVFAQVHKAVPFHLLVEFFSEFYGFVETYHFADVLEKDVSEPVEFRIENEDQLRLIYDEISALSLNQRRALLLNLKDDEGGAMLPVFPVMGIASIRQLAETLEIPLESFITYWNASPLEDSKIAEILGITKFQVAHLIQSARERLSRRMQKPEGNMDLNS